MPYKDVARQREYQRLWIAERRASWFRGKVCVDCGSDRDLELDHLDPLKKVSHRIWSWSETRRDEEVAKCVVRCQGCHLARSSGQASERMSGEKNRWAKLTQEQAWEIFQSDESGVALASRYGISRQAVCEIKKMRSWRKMHYSPRRSYSVGPT